MPAPVWTTNAAGNVLATTTLSHTGALQTFVLDYTAVMRGKIQVVSTGGATVAGVNGTQIVVYSRSACGGTPVNDTFVMMRDTAPNFVSFVTPKTYDFDSGLYFVTIQNLDVTNDVTVQVTSDTLSWPS